MPSAVVWVPPAVLGHGGETVLRSLVLASDDQNVGDGRDEEGRTFAVAGRQVGKVPTTNHHYPFM